MPQNQEHDQQEEEDNEKEEEGGNKAKGEEDEDCTPWSNTEQDEIFHDADEIKTFGDEAPIPIGRLRMCCHTPFRDKGNEDSICVPRMFHSHV
jgi:hypothetical protein